MNKKQILAAPAQRPSIGAAPVDIRRRRPVPASLAALAADSLSIGNPAKVPPIFPTFGLELGMAKSTFPVWATDFDAYWWLFAAAWRDGDEDAGTPPSGWDRGVHVEHLGDRDRIPWSYADAIPTVSARLLRELAAKQLFLECVLYLMESSDCPRLRLICGKKAPTLRPALVSATAEARLAGALSVADVGFGFDLAVDQSRTIEVTHA